MQHATGILYIISYGNPTIRPILTSHPKVHTLTQPIPSLPAKNNPHFLQRTMAGAGGSGSDKLEGADKLEVESIGSGKFSNLEVGSSSGSSEDPKRVKIVCKPLPLEVLQQILLQTGDYRNKFRFVSKELNKLIPPLNKPVTYRSAHGDFRVVEFGVYLVKNTAFNQTKILKLRRVSDEVFGSVDESPLRYTKECRKYDLVSLDLFTGRLLSRVLDEKAVDLENPDIEVRHVMSHWSINFSDGDGKTIVPSPFNARNGSLNIFCPAVVVLEDDGVDIKCVVYECQRSLVAIGMDKRDEVERCFVPSSPGEGVRFESLVLFGGNVYAKERGSRTCYRLDTRAFDLLFTSGDDMPKLVEKLEIPLSAKWRGKEPNENLVCHLASDSVSLYALFRKCDEFSVFELRGGVFEEVFYLNEHFVIFGDRASFVIPCGSGSQSMESFVLYEASSYGGYGLGGEIDYRVVLLAASDNEERQKSLPFPEYIDYMFKRNPHRKGVPQWENVKFVSKKSVENVVGNAEDENVVDGNAEVNVVENVRSPGTGGTEQ